MIFHVPYIERRFAPPDGITEAEYNFVKETDYRKFARYIKGQGWRYCAAFIRAHRLGLSCLVLLLIGLTADLILEAFFLFDTQKFLTDHELTTGFLIILAIIIFSAASFSFSLLSFKADFLDKRWRYFRKLKENIDKSGTYTEYNAYNLK